MRVSLGASPPRQQHRAAELEVDGGGVEKRRSQIPQQTWRLVMSI